MDQREERIPFRIALGPDKALGDASLEHFVRAQIEALLDVVVLTSGGKTVQVDGFIWVRDAFQRTTDPAVAPIALGASLTSSTDG